MATRPAFSAHCYLVWHHKRCSYALWEVTKSNMLLICKKQSKMVHTVGVVDLVRAGCNYNRLIVYEICCRSLCTTHCCSLYCSRSSMTIDQMLHPPASSVVSYVMPGCPASRGIHATWTHGTVPCQRLHFGHSPARPHARTPSSPTGAAT